MNASASLRAAQIPTGVARMLMIALLAAAFLLGGTGGYLVRDLGVSWPAGTTNGTLVQLWDCNGTGAQAWQSQSNGALVNPQSGRCLDDPAGNTANGTPLQIWECNSGTNQQWRLS